MTSPQELDLATSRQVEAFALDCATSRWEVAWIDSYDLANRLDAEVTYVQHCLREAPHVERFCYGDGWYLAYIDAHLTHQPGTRPFRVPVRTARIACPCCHLQQTTDGKCPQS